MSALRFIFGDVDAITVALALWVAAVATCFIYVYREKTR